MAKFIGLDVGTKRIGVAKADSDVRIAIPIETVQVDGGEFARIAQIARLLNTNLFIVGLPRNNNGEETAQSTYARNFAKQLKTKIPGAKVCFQDESLTSVEAEGRLKNRKNGFQKGDIDAEAAAIILQDFVEKAASSIFKTEENEPAQPTKKSKPKKLNPKKIVKTIKKHPIISTTVCLASIILLFLGFGSLWYFNNTKSVYSNSECSTKNSCEKSIDFTVSQGESSSSIAEHLKEQGLIRNTLAFKVYLFLHSMSGDLKAGNYQMLKTSSVAEIADILSRGGSAAVFELTILPGEKLSDVKDRLLGLGYNINDIREVLSGEGIDHPVLASKPAGASLEGYLYGETYEFYLGEDLKNVITVILDELYKVVQENDLVNKYKTEGLTLHEGIILASIVQKEAKTEDQPTVAQVFLTRLSRGIKLGSDVTVSYAVDQVDPYRNKYTTNVSAIYIDSCYNTRLNAGLPCGPVSNPGASALIAVANPSDTSYLYFLTGDDGKMYYSYTDAEHTKNISAHCKVLCNASL